MRHIQYQGETLPPSPPSPLVLAFHLVLGKFHIYNNNNRTDPKFQKIKMENPAFVKKVCNVDGGW